MKVINYEPSITAFIGKEVRRFVFFIKVRLKLLQFVHIDCVLPEMSDYDASPTNSSHPFCAFISSLSGKKDKVFLSVDRFILTEDFINNLWNNTIIDGNRIHTETENYKWRTENQNKPLIIPLHDESNTRSELVDILPKCHCYAYVNYCLPADNPKCDIITQALRQNSILKQVKVTSN